jgi:Ca-activated chloride channel family protein
VETQKTAQFGNLQLVKNLSAESSVFKPALKLAFVALAIAGIVLALVNPKIGTRTEKVKREG